MNVAAHESDRPYAAHASADPAARILLFVLLLLAAFVCYWHLGTRTLADWDEAIYAQVAKEAARGGHWLTLHWAGQPWFEKPPLYVWTTALLFRLFGVSEFWARAASAAAGVGVVAVTYALGRAIYGRRVGLWGACVLLTSYQFLFFARFGTTDVLLTLFIYLALYGYVRLSARGPRWWYLIWAACALAFMVKGAAGLVAPATVGLALCFERDRRAPLRTREFWCGCLLALLIVAPWHVLMYARHGRAFVAEYVGYHTLARMTTALEGHEGSYFYYVGRLVDGFFPWVLLVPAVIIAGLKRRGANPPGGRVLWLLCALVFVLYTLARTKIAWYIVPLYPALALLVAAFTARVYDRYRARPFARRAVVAACALLAVVGALYSFLLLRAHERAENPVAQLARQAARDDASAHDALLLLSDGGAFARPAALFYSDRPVRQTYLADRPADQSAPRYFAPEELSAVTSIAPQPVILRRADAARLAGAYDMQVRAEAGPLLYGTIRRKE